MNEPGVFDETQIGLALTMVLCVASRSTGKVAKRNCKSRDLGANFEYSERYIVWQTSILNGLIQISSMSMETLQAARQRPLI